MTEETRFNIAFISSALSPEKETGWESFDFFAVLLGGIVRRAQDLPGRVSVYIPRKEGSDETNQADLLERVLEIKDRFEAIIIAPFNTDVVIQKLNEFMQARPPPSLGLTDGRGTPLIFVDKPVDPEGLDPAVKEVFSLASVSCDNQEGGKHAAQLLIDAFHEDEAQGRSPADKMDRKFMILKGLEGSDDRAKGFGEEIKRRYPNHELKIVDNDGDLNFTRSGARSWMHNQLRRLRCNEVTAFGKLTEASEWGVFACNDEMALGIHSVIAAQHRVLRERVAAANSGSRMHAGIATDVDELIFLQNIKIVGFDGIGAARELISPIDGVDDPWLVGTVQAHVDRQSERAVDWAKRLYKEPKLRGKNNTSVVSTEKFGR